VVVRDLQLRGANQDAVRIGGGNNISLLNCEVFAPGRRGVAVSTPQLLYRAGLHGAECNEGGMDVDGGYAQVRYNRIENTGLFPRPGQENRHGLTALTVFSYQGFVTNNTILKPATWAFTSRKTT
jgi:hypothetical protein